MRSLYLLVLLASCIDANTVVCNDGRSCPAGSACDSKHEDICVRPSQLTTCLDSLDGDPCQITAPGDGICDQNVCIVARCGDGYLRGDEACDGQDIPADVTCQSRGFYVAGPVACNDACGIDDSACAGFCGDGSVTPDKEVCEPTIASVLACVDFGYGAGVLGCNMCAPGLDDCRRFGWEFAALSFAPIDVNGTSDENVFVVGPGDGSGPGQAAHFDGKAWTTLDLGGCFGAAPVPDVSRVWAIGDRDAVIVGAAGTVLHVTSAGCTKLPAPSANPLYAVWASSATDIYTYDGTNLWHYAGSWTVALAGTFSGIWGTGPTNVVVADSDKNILRYNGAWSAPEAVPGINFMGTVWGEGADLYVSGKDISGGAYVAHFDGTSWTPAFSDGASFGGFGSMLVAGATGGGATIATGFTSVTTGTVPILIVGDGTGWRSIDSPTTNIASSWVSPTGTAYVVARESSYVSVLSQIRFDALVGTEGQGRWLAARSASEVFAGGTPPSNTYRWNGFSWFVEPDIVGSSLAVAVGPAGETYGIGQSSGQGMFRYTHGASPAWVLDKAGPFGHQLTVAGTSDVWYIGANGGVAHWTGGNSSATYPLLDRNGNAADMTDVWAAGPSDVFAVGSAGTIQHWNGTTWQAHLPPTTVGLTGVWGRAGNDVHAWGPNTLLHFDGTSWTALALPPMTTPRGLWAGGPADVFVISAERGLIRYNGVTWAPVNVGTNIPLFDIAGTGDSIFVSDEIGAVHQLLRTAAW